MTNDRSSGFSSEECRKGSASLSASAQTIAVKSEQDRLADFAAAAVNVAAPKVAALVKAMPERAPTTHEKDEYPGGYMFTTARLLSTATVVRLASGVDAPWSRCASANCAPLPALVAGSPYCPPVKPGAIMEVDAKSLVATCGAPHPTGLCTAALSAAATMVVAEAFQRDSGSLYEHFDVELKELDGELRAELLPDMLTEPIYAETVLHELDTSRRNIAIAMASSRMRSVLPNKRGPTRLNEDEKRQVVQDVCSLVTMERAGLKKAPTSYSLTLDANYNECSGPAMGQYVTVPDEIRSRYDEESARGGKCADAVIEANRATIEALAARLLKYPPSKTQPLVMNGHEVTQWFCEHPVIAPEKLPAGTESFCKR
jgi:hypothetical protein